MTNAYIQENNKLANDILNRNYYHEWRNGNKVLELLLCQPDSCFCTNYYCKIPCEKNVDFETCKHNFVSLIDWYIANEFCCDIRLLLNNKTINILNVKNICDDLCAKFSEIKTLPKNVFLVLNKYLFLDKNSYEILRVISSQFESLKINLFISINIDGKYVENFSDEYYQELFSFTAQSENIIIVSVIHPEDSSKWIDNFLWWSNLSDDILCHVRFIEEPSDKWDITQFETYSKMLLLMLGRFLSEDELKDPSVISQLLITDSNQDTALPIQLKINHFTTGRDFVDCPLNTSLTIDCQNMSVRLCTGISDDRMEMGNFVLNEESGLQYVSKIAEMFIVKDHLKTSNLPYCERCPFVGVCNKTCYAQSFNIYRSPLMAIHEYCEWQSTKMKFLIHCFYNAGVFSYLRQYIQNESEAQYFSDLIDYVEREYENK